MFITPLMVIKISLRETRKNERLKNARRCFYHHVKVRGPHYQ